jgi:3-hydroxyisobutyrate dehydrogenase
MKNQLIAVVGVGRMGANMARRLKECGHTITAVFDANQAVAEALADEIGCMAATSLSDVAASSEVILTVVTDDAAMLAIFLAPGDSLLHHGKGKTFINCATLSPAVQIDIATAIHQSGGHCVEACMASSITQARQGTLYLMLGGTAEEIAGCEEILADLSASRRHVGPAGHAAKVKALVNMVMNINTAALAEGLGLGHALGVDMDMLREVFSQTGANSRVLETDAADMVCRDHDCYFSAAHAAKDSGIANDLAADLGVDVPLSLATEAQYRKLCAIGRGDLDKSAIAELTFPGRAQSPL